MNITEKDKKETVENLKRAIAENLKTLPLQPGNYILTRDVTNPYSDKRKKYDWRDHVIWKSGTEFIVTEHHNDIEFDGVKIDAPYYTVTPRSGSSYRLNVRRPSDADDTDALKLQALAGSLQKVQAERLGDLFTGNSFIGQDQAVYLVALLFDEGKITMADLQKAAKDLNEMVDYQAIRDKHGL